MGPLLFILCTAPVSSLASDPFVKHHLYAGDTQLFISFSVHDFSPNIAHRKTTIDNVSICLSANLLSFNHSKTEFVHIGLPKQLSKITDLIIIMPSNATISPTESAPISCFFIFDSSLKLSNHNFVSASKS